MMTTLSTSTSETDSPGSDELASRRAWVAACRSLPDGVGRQRLRAHEGGWPGGKMPRWMSASSISLSSPRGTRARSATGRHQWPRVSSRTVTREMLLRSSWRVGAARAARSVSPSLAARRWRPCRRRGGRRGHGRSSLRAHRGMQRDVGFAAEAHRVGGPHGRGLALRSGCTEVRRAFHATSRCLFDRRGTRYPPQQPGEVVQRLTSPTSTPTSPTPP
jgi:hypothetical protein